MVLKEWKFPTSCLEEQKMPSIFLERSNTSKNKGPVKTLLVQCLNYKESFILKDKWGIMKMHNCQTINILAFWDFDSVTRNVYRHRHPNANYFYTVNVNKEFALGCRFLYIQGTVNGFESSSIHFLLSKCQKSLLWQHCVWRMRLHQELNTITKSLYGLRKFWYTKESA